MIVELFEGFGLNSSLFVDVGFCLGVLYCMLTLMVGMRGKGIIMPLIVKPMFRRVNAAIIDLGGIETPIINYPRGSNELKFEHKDNKFSWTIPSDIERTFQNNTKYILANIRGPAFNQYAKTEAEAAQAILATVKPDKDGKISEGEAFNMSVASEQLRKIGKMLSPKGQANTIDDRAKQIADKQLANVNKAFIYGAAIAIVFIVMLGGYLVLTKAMEYKVCEAGISQIQNLQPLITTTTLKPL